MEKDWRLTNQEKYLTGRHLIRTDFVPDGDNDHAHCAFCWEKFGEYWQHTGYRTAAGRRIRYRGRIVVQYDWICEKCFRDFQERFRWAVVTDRSINDHTISHLKP